LIRKTEATIFYIEYNKKFKTAVVAIFIKESLVQQIAIKAHFEYPDTILQAEIVERNYILTKKSEQITSPFLIS
jgi:hypothetical protein